MLQKIKYIFSVLAVILFFSCNNSTKNYRKRIDLSGAWQFMIDSADEGINNKWYLTDLTDTIHLPGTTDLYKKGYKNKDTVTRHLNRTYKYEGPAWYRKKIHIPENWKGCHVSLVLERTKPAKVWIDTNYIGSSLLLQSPQRYEISSHLTPGNHTITIRVDNSLEQTPYGNVHIYSDDTQTNWNGIIGKLFLEASDRTHISDIKIYPDIKNKKIKVLIYVKNIPEKGNIDVELKVFKTINYNVSKLKNRKYSIACDTLVELEYELKDETNFWDEYIQPVYRLNATISRKGQFNDNLSTTFGLREFKVKETQFAINNRITFLRGKHDACVFPLTGYPPMDTEEWTRVLKIAKSYGINHYRFHSWCPPEAAFVAADKLGIYFQVELPYWKELKPGKITNQLLAEGIAMLKSYANHPSFVMMSLGNELSGNKTAEILIAKLKTIDNRPLYTQGSNNNIGHTLPVCNADFHLAAWVPSTNDTLLSTRLTHAFADATNGGILNTRYPSTKTNYSDAVSQINIPLISHEIGQYQIYPDFSRIDKYTGVLKPWNLEVFKRRLENAGMIDQNKMFTKASGALAALCYRAEIEAALRTKGMAGFQLLDLQDFPGQGTALVGILDAFMDSKNVISRKEWTHSCNDIVILSIFNKFCFTDNETFSAEIKVANYSNKTINNNLKWELKNKKGNILQEGEFFDPNIEQGKLNMIGTINIPLKNLTVPDKLTLNLSVENTLYQNSYPLWVYPGSINIKNIEKIITVSELNNDIITKLEHGAKVLFFPNAEKIKDHCINGLFTPDFWNYGMFKNISKMLNKPVSPGTLGILTNPNHPLFNNFPTEFHTNWQWWSIIRNSHPLILNKTDKRYRPIVQIIDNPERNYKLGLIFEFKIKKGKLLVCMSDLRKIQNRPEAVQLYRSIVNYMLSEDFNPSFSVDKSLLTKLFY